MAEALVSLTEDELHNIWSTGFATRIEHKAFRSKVARALIAIEDGQSLPPARLRVIHEQDQAEAAKGDTPPAREAEGAA